MVKEYEPLLIFIEDHIFDKILLYGSFFFCSCRWNIFDMKYLYLIELQANMISFQNAGDLCFLHGICICGLFRCYAGKTMMIQRRI